MPARWERTTVIAVGGLTEVGVVPGSTLLLVVSHQGRSVIDLRTGEVLGRDRDEDASAWFDFEGPRALAVGPAQGWIDVAGLSGGSLPTTHDGHTLMASADGVAVTSPDGGDELLPEMEELRAFGFVPTDAIVIATPSTLSIFHRAGA